MQALAILCVLTLGLVADTLIDNLTVQEMLLYTAELKLKATVPLDAKLRRVDALIEQLALGVCRNVRIGDAMKRGISGSCYLCKRCPFMHHPCTYMSLVFAGGQAKRTNIGVALISSPRILFLDEPTSGLDSYTSLEALASCSMGSLPGNCDETDALCDRLTSAPLRRSCSMWQRSRPPQRPALAPEAAA